jgi:general secretion pathway protein D
MKTKIFYPTIVILMCVSSVLFAQNQIPREYINPQELVSFNSDLDLTIALDLLSEYSIQYAQKPIYDPQKRSGAIGMDIRSLAWQKALGLILSRKGLWYVEKPRFFEIVKATQAETSLSSDPLIDLGENISLKPGSREIKIETIFFEGDRKMLSEIGLDWSTFYRGKVGIEASQVGALNLKEEFFSLKTNLSRNLIGVDVDLLLKAFDSKKLGKVLAQPQVIVTEGKEGDIQVGQDFSIKERDFAGNVIDRFYSTGTILKVTPFIIKNKKEKGGKEHPIIFLRIHVERSTAHPDVVSTIINKSQANSFIQLYDGEETLIAGLYSTENNKIRKGVPILKDFPWWFLGFPYLFGYNSIEESEKELIIIIKATLLKNVYDRHNVAQTDVMNLKNSIVENHGVKLKNYNYSPQQLVTNTDKKFQASATSTLAESNNATYKTTDNMVNTVEKKIQSQKYNFAQQPSSISTKTEPDNSDQETIDNLVNALEKDIEPQNYNLAQQTSTTSTMAESNNDGHENIDNLINPVEKKVPAKKFRFGRITNLKNKLVLVEWFDTIDKYLLLDQKLPVLRKDNVKKTMDYIGTVQIIETRKNQSVGKEIFNNENFREGDYLVLPN